MIWIFLSVFWHKIYRKSTFMIPKYRYHDLSLWRSTFEFSRLYSLDAKKWLALTLWDDEHTSHNPIETGVTIVWYRIIKVFCFNAMTTWLNELAAEEYDLRIWKLIDRYDKILNAESNFGNRCRKLPVCNRIVFPQYVFRFSFCITKLDVRYT